VTLNAIKFLLQNRLVTLSQARAHAVTIGDLMRVSELDSEIAETESTLGQINTL
jgi:hypothetical protein